MDINAKIKLIAETMTGYTVLVDTSNGANVKLDKITMPCILVFIQETGEFASNNSHYRDSINVRVAVLNKMPKGFIESDIETMRYALKQDMVILYHKLKFDFQFKINNETVRYEIVYDEFDANLLGVVFNDNIKERVGLNLACDVPDSHGELPSSPSFCQKVSECPSIVSINELIEGLQEQIDNLPTTSGVESVTGENVDNTDPLNPVVNPQTQLISQDGNTNVSAFDGQVNMGVTDGVNSSLVTINPDSINLDSESVTKNGYEIATENFVDNRVQSNIKIIGDWDATSGSYPLADESNTTPFISQWGATIKAGWAFRVGYGQAGTVDGFDYENGDVVYALIDSPTDNSTDWGDLDHNLQQANESLRGTAKIVTAAIITDETSTDDERIVTTKKLWLNFWERAKLLSFLDATSSIQTQLNAKADSSVWHDISSTVTVIGFSGTPTVSVWYKISDGMATVIFNLSGTSNTNSLIVTDLPFTANANQPQNYTGCRVTNNSVSLTTNGRVRMDAGLNTFIIQRDMAGATFIAGGTKAADGQFQVMI